MTKTTQKWDTERTDLLTSIVGTETPVTQAIVAQAATSLEVSDRSISSKLRNMGYEVATKAAEAPSYTEAETAELEAFLNANPNSFTYAEIAAQVLGNSRSPKQIQGKILSMDLYSLVKATPKVERAKTYTEEEEATLLELARAGNFIEDIAEIVNREVNSVRGKYLSLSRVYDDITIPKQKNYKDKQADAFANLGDVSEMSVADIAEKIEKSERGVKTILSHRGVDCADYKGAARRAKLDAAKTEASV